MHNKIVLKMEGILETVCFKLLVSFMREGGPKQ